MEANNTGPFIGGLGGERIMISNMGNVQQRSLAAILSLIVGSLSVMSILMLAVETYLR